MDKDVLIDIVVYTLIAICLTATILYIQFYSGTGVNLYTHPLLPIYNNPLLWLFLIGCFTLIYSFKTYFEVYAPIEKKEEKENYATHK